MVHLAYIMYVPGLSVERLSLGGAPSEHIVRLQCNADSVLGTTAYIISRGACLPYACRWVPLGLVGFSAYQCPPPTHTHTHTHNVYLPAMLTFQAGCVS